MQTVTLPSSVTVTESLGCANLQSVSDRLQAPR
jgi:hypothetical protein